MYMTIPYTYLITFLPTGQYYYGVRFKKGCSPEDFWTKYFTSSKYIADLIEEYGKDSFSIEIRKTFLTKDDAILWEQRFLTRVNAAKNPKFLNKSNGNKQYFDFTGVKRPEHSERMKGENNPAKKPGVGAKISEANRNRSPEVRAKLSAANLRRDPEIYARVSEKNKGKKHSAETISKLSQIALDRDKILCPHCKTSATPSLFARWHGDNCLEVTSAPRVSNKEANEKHSNTVNSEEWKASAYKECPHCNKLSDPGNYVKNHGDNCKKFTGISSAANKKAQETRLKTISDPEWKAKNYKTCEHCGKLSDPGNHAKHHGIKCKNNNKA